MLGDDRGQSIQIGAILLFGILIIGLAIVQTVVVPTENEQVEFNGYLETTEDLVTLRNDILTAGTQGGEQAEMVKTGVRYPSRAVLINPGPPVGSLRTNETRTVTISGAAVVSGEEANVRGYWNSTPHDYETKTVRFSPAYNHIDVPPIEVSSTGAYRTTDNGPIALAGGTFISGNRITVVTVDGNLSTSSLTTSVGVTPKSVATRSVTLQAESGEDLVVTVPVPGNGTEAAAEAWLDSSAADSLRSSDSTVESLSRNGTRVDIILDDSETFELRLANVVVHDAGDSGINTSVKSEYLVPLDANGTEVPTNGSKRLSVEVRDKFNNPVEGARVEFSVTSGTLDSSSSVVTGSDGRASVQFDITNDVDSATLSASINGGSKSYESATIELARAGAGDNAGGTGTDINPGDRSGDLVLLDSTLAGCSGNSGNNCDRVDVTFRNFDSNSSKNITDIKFSFYAANGPGDSEQKPPASVFVNGDETATLEYRGDFTSYGEEFSTNEQDTIQFEFRTNGGGSYTVRNGNFFIISALVDTDDDGTADRAYNYFVAPESP